MTSNDCSIVTMGLSCTISEMNDDMCKIFPPRVFNAPAGSIKYTGYLVTVSPPWNFVDGSGAQKAMPLSDHRKCGNMCIHLDTRLALNGQMADGIAKTISCSAYIAY